MRGYRRSLEREGVAEGGKKKEREGRKSLEREGGKEGRRKEKGVMEGRRGED